MKKQTVLHSAVVIIAFFIAFYGKKLLGSFVDISLTSNAAKLIYHYLWWVVPVVIAVGALYGFSNVIRELRLHTGFLVALVFAAVVVSPMFVHSAIVGEIDMDMSLAGLLHKTLLAGFLEEFLFRGFLFGILFRKLGWGFIPAAMLGAVMFGLGHLYQGSTLGQVLGVFIVTFMGAMWFAWLFMEWYESLWVPIMLHFFMNVSWVLFNVGDNALGDNNSNTFRIITIALTVVITILYKRRKGGFRVNKHNLLWDKTPVN